jgi:RNA polymerase sigma factor (sigma-70 family)
VNEVQPSPESELIAAEDRGRIVLAVRSLPVATRDAVSLRYGLGWSTREIAHLLGKSEPATQKLIERGLRVLRETLR